VVPILHSWGARALYIGPSLQLSAHRNAVAVLAVGLDSEFAVAADPRNPRRGARSCRTALIPPNTLHHLESAHGRMAFLYVDALSRDYGVLQASVGTLTERAGFDLADEHALLEMLSSLADGRTDFATTRRRLERLIPGEPKHAIDAKVLRAIRYLHKHVAERPSLAALADRAHLSASRFRHAFKETTGVTLRRYRLWIAMGLALRAVQKGASLTHAAQRAGFSSSAHFSSTFREMFGIEPSRIVTASLLR
jgi:AraC-like DNA-binding protein